MMQAISFEVVLQTILIIGAIVALYVKISVRLAKLQVKVNFLWAQYSAGDTEQGDL